MGHIKGNTTLQQQYITRRHLIPFVFQCNLPVNMKLFLLCVVCLFGLTLATEGDNTDVLDAVNQVESEIEDLGEELRDIGISTSGIEATLKALDDTVKDELKDLKKLVEDEFDDLKYILNIVLGKVDKVLHKPRFGFGPGPKYGHGHKYGGYGRGYGHKYGPPKKYGYGHGHGHGYGHGYGKKGW